MDFFSYYASDGIYDSEIVTVTIRENGDTVVANEDSYWTEPNTMLEVTEFHDGLLANDYDYDGTALTAHLVDDVTYGTLNLNPDGTFDYTPPTDWAGEDWFTYYATNGIDSSVTVMVTIQINPEWTYVDMIIHDGQFGGALSSDEHRDPFNPIPLYNEEELVGAVTVANINDTDGDNKMDAFDDDGVVGYSPSIDEVDLMKLRLLRPAPYDGVTPAVLKVARGNVAFWEESSKINAVTNTNFVFAEGEEEKVIWVEALRPSLFGPRDIVLEYSYRGQKDVVTATAVWAALSAREYGDRRANASVILPPGDLFAPPEVWAEIPTGHKVRSEVELLTGTGLRPWPSRGQSGDFGFFNGILMRFTIFPEQFHDHPKLNFDITRRIEGANYWLYQDGHRIENFTDFPQVNDHPNDDEQWKLQPAGPTENGHMFIYDAPGPNPGGGRVPQVKIAMAANFEEFVRVGIGMEPSGNEVSGSLASVNYDWHVHHRIERDEEGDLDRTSKHDADNNIGFGHIEIRTFEEIFGE